MKKASNVIKWLGIALIGLIVIAAAFYVVSLLRQVTPEQAQKASQKHFDDVKSKITEVSGYKIVTEGHPSYVAVSDEMGAKDYTLAADFLVQKMPSGSTASSVEADIADFTKQLPGNSYGIAVENTPQVDNRPISLCVYASRYLNDDGTYITQGPNANVGKYIAKDDFAAGHTSKCADLLRLN